MSAGTVDGAGVRLAEDLLVLSRQVARVREAVAGVVGRCGDRGMPAFLASETGPQALLALGFLAEEIELEARFAVEGDDQ